MESYNSLIRKIESFIRKYYLNEMLKGIIIFLTTSLILLLAIILFEYYNQFNSAIRTGLFYFFLASTLLVFTFFLIKPILGLMSIRRDLSHKEASKIIGNHFPEVDDKLQNLIELNELSEKESDLLSASINQKIQNLKPLPFNLAIRFKESLSFIKYLAIPAIIFIGVFIYKPSIVLQSTSRLVAHNMDFLPKAPYEIYIENDELKTFKREGFKLKVKLKGSELPSSLIINHNDKEFRMKKENDNSFSYFFNMVESNTIFTLNDGIYSSDYYTLEAIPKPLLKNFQIIVEYPSYLGKKKDIINNTGDLNVPEGSSIKWEIETEDTDELLFLIQDSTSQTNNSAANNFNFQSRVYKNSPYSIIIKNKSVAFSDTLDYDISVIKDQYPTISLIEEVDSSTNKMIYLSGIIKDDYGFSKLQFVVYKQKDGIKTENSEQALPYLMGTESPFAYTLNTSLFQLEPGENLWYYFEVWDNDKVNGSKSSRTKPKKFRAPTLKELEKNSDEKAKEIETELEKNIELSKEIRKDLEELKQKMLDKKELGFQEKKQIEKVLEKQKKLKNSVEKLNKKNNEKSEIDKQLPDNSEQIKEKQEQLEELFEKVMSDEMKELIKQLEKMMEELNKDNIQKAIEKLEVNNEDIEKELDRNLELFKQLEVEKELMESINKLEKLKEKQQELKENTSEKSLEKEKLIEKQDSLNKEFQDLEKKLDSLEKKNEELESPNNIERNSPLEEKIKEDMKKSLESLQKNNKNEATEKQEDSEEGMQEMLDELNQMQMEMSSNQTAENIEDLRALLENLIQLSFDQEDVMDELSQTKRDDPNYVKIGQKQKKLKDDAKLIEDSLFALSKRVIQIQPTVNREVSKINLNMDKAIDELGERNTPAASARQQLSMTSINNLALMLDEAVQNMMQQMMQSKGLCKKPGSKGSKPKPGNMKSMQEQLNKEMESLKKSMGKGKGKGEKGNKGEKPKSGEGKGQMSKELAQMAAKQAAIRKAIEEMENGMKNGGGTKGSESGKKLSELMEETETDLVNKRITNETILRQQEILTRLLQSEKAEREREKDEQRKSIEFTDDIFRNPNKILEYNRQKQQQIELLQSMPPSLNNFYKKKVTEYFNDINQ